MRKTEEITKWMLDKMRLAPRNNMVLVKIILNEGRKTAAGIIVGFNDDYQYAEGSGSHVADMAEVHGTVVKCPDKLYYDLADPYSMSWDTDMMLQPDDEVWFSFIASTHTTGFLVDDEIYIFIPYGDMYVAKRGDTVIPLNGYVLLSDVQVPKTTFLYLAEEDKVDIKRGVVRYVGEPNRQYRFPQFSDEIDVAIGDTVQMKAGFTPYRLERQNYFADFGEMLWVVQRRNIEFNYGKD